MERRGLRVGDEVVFSVGTYEERGTVHEIYESGPGVMVVIVLSPELSGSTVAEPTTVVWPIEKVRKVAPLPGG